MPSASTAMPSMAPYSARQTERTAMSFPIPAAIIRQRRCHDETFNWPAIPGSDLVVGSGYWFEPSPFLTLPGIPRDPLRDVEGVPARLGPLAPQQPIRQGGALSHGLGGAVRTSIRNFGELGANWLAWICRYALCMFQCTIVQHRAGIMDLLPAIRGRMREFGRQQSWFVC